MSSEKSPARQTQTASITRSPKKATPAKKTAAADKKKITELKTRIGELEDKNLRLRAEFENYRRRKEHEIVRLLTYSGEDVIRTFLTVIDDLERMQTALNNDPGNGPGTVTKGIELILSKIQNKLQELGVVPIQAVGELLDSNLHDAMMVMEEPGKREHEILQVFEKGYMYKDKVLRHAKVVVNK